MNIEITERIPRDKWLAALGTHGTRDESLNETLDEVESALLAAAKPKAIYRVMDIADIKVQGFSLKKHLEGCHKVIVMALTLGIGTDNLIRKLRSHLRLHCMPRAFRYCRLFPQVPSASSQL